MNFVLSQLIKDKVVSDYFDSDIINIGRLANLGVFPDQSDGLFNKQIQFSAIGF